MYRLSPLSGSRTTIDTWLETVNIKLLFYEEIVRTSGDTGLPVGEMSPEETGVLIDPEERTLRQITVSDVKQANQMFEDLMGKAVEPRKVYIKEHSAEAIINE